MKCRQSDGALLINCHSYFSELQNGTPLFKDEYCIQSKFSRASSTYKPAGQSNCLPTVSIMSLTWSYSITTKPNHLCHALSGNRRIGYKISFWNCRKKLVSDSFENTNKFVDVKAYVKRHRPHLLAIIESDLHSEASRVERAKYFTKSDIEEKLNIAGYNLHLPDTWENHGQARLVVFVSEELNVKRKPLENPFVDLPNITFEVGLGREKKTTVNFFYREFMSGVTGENSQASQLERLERQIQYWHSLHNLDRDVLLCGDANVCALSWNDNNYDNNRKVLANKIQDYLLQSSSAQLVQDYTRSESYNGMVSRSCLDHIYTNAPLKCDKPTVESAGDSDHLAVMVTKFTRELRLKPHNVLKRNYKYFNLVEFLTDIQQSSLNQKVLNCEDLETAADTFQQEFGQILDRHAPLKIFQSRNHYLPYLSAETKILMRERDALKEEATKGEDASLFEEYKRKRNEVKSRLKTEEAEFYENKFQKSQPSIKKVWNTIYDIIGKVNNKAPTKIKVDDKVITSPKTMANIFNSTFQNKVRKLREQTSTRPKTDPLERLRRWLSRRPSETPTFSLKTINIAKLRQTLKKLKPSRAHGIDFIDANSIKVAAPLIEDSILHLVNLSISSGMFASSWKTQLVLPLHKKSDKLTATNYRPVSHIIEMGKLVEYIIHDQVYNHFFEHSLFHSNHHGFLRDHSTATALAQLQDMWLTASEDQKLSAALLLDLSAAFDVVDHLIFINKLKTYNFSSQTIKWFSSYLSNRRQIVQVETKFSDPEDLAQHGVPQGSILGPLISIIFNNDFPDCSEEGEAVLYADDDTTNVSDEDPIKLQEKIQREATLATEWVSDNRMVCSGDKTKLLIIGTAQRRKRLLTDRNIKIQIEVCGKKVTESNSEKLLGLTVNNQQTWRDYLYGEQWREKDNEPGLIQQLSQRVGLLRRVVHLMPEAKFNTICQGIFYSKLLYCLQIVGNVWGVGTTDEETRRFTAFTKEDNRKLQVLQNMVLRMKTKMPRGTETTTLLSRSGDLSVQQLTALSSLTTLQKMIHSGKPEYITRKLSMNMNPATRQENMIKLRSNLTITRGAYVYRASSIYNNLPPEMRANMDPKLFKSQARTWVKQNIPPKPT